MLQRTEPEPRHSGCGARLKQSCSSDFLGNGRIMAFPLLSSSAGKEFGNHQPFGWLLFFFILFRFSTLFVLWSRVLCSSHSEDDLTHRLLFIGWLLNYFVPRCFYFYFFFKPTGLIFRTAKWASFWDQFLGFLHVKVPSGGRYLKFTSLMPPVPQNCQHASHKWKKSTFTWKSI